MSFKKEIEWRGETLSIESGRIARQADGAVLVSYGNTSVLCTVVSAKKAKEGVDFFPLTVHHKEMAFASGKIPGGFFKREGKPSEREVLISRLIDRPIRPLFPSDFCNETQIICTVVSYDPKCNPDIVSLIGASAALSISGAPFEGPVAACRVGVEDGKFVLNPNNIEEEKNYKLDLVVAGTKDSVLMVESEATELSEKEMLDAVKFGHEQFQPVIRLIEDFAKEVGKEVWYTTQEKDDTLYNKIDKAIRKDIESSYKITLKSERYEELSHLRSKTVDDFLAEANDNESEISSIIKKIEQDVVRSSLLKSKVRIDGRGPDEIRNITCEVGILPKTHGSALFTRGETQALVVTTLGTNSDAQIIETVHGEYKQNFMMHYNFPPYSVGEASMLKPPGRREIGHGKLAWRGLNALIPTAEEFPYTIRNVSEITESNGSSSMASICGASLAMMDSGVPLKEPVAGIAMGLVQEGNKSVVLSDIMGDEDHLGDMDFKVAGTKNGITALQMDIKIKGITFATMEKALKQAKDGRLHILSKMNEVLGESRSEIHKNAPVVITLKIAQDKIRDLIGTGGKVIRGLCEETGAKIEVDDTGAVSIFAANKEIADLTHKKVNEIVVDPEINDIYSGKVVKIADFGAFVNFLGAREGLVHISEVKEERIEDMKDVLSEGDIVKVKVIGFDKGKIKLSMKAVDQETGESLTEDVDPNANRGNRKNFNKKDSGNRGNKHNRDNRDSKDKRNNNNRTRENKKDVIEERKYYS